MDSNNTRNGLKVEYSIALARQNIEHLIAMAESSKIVHPGSILEASRAGVLILAWLERRQELMRALDRLERERPDLADLFREFPGSQIADVRSMLPAFNNGSGYE